MDASASPAIDADLNGVFGFFLKIGDSVFARPIKHHNTVIKYTKLPNYDFDSKLSWPDKNLNSHPCQRRVITLDDPRMISSRSLKQELIKPVITTKANMTKRKVVAITEDGECDLHPNFSRNKTREISPKTQHKAAETNFKVGKQFSQRATSRLTNTSKYSKETKLNAKTNNASNRKDISPKINYKSKNSNMSLTPTDASKYSKETKLNAKTNNASNRKDISSKINYKSKNSNMSLTPTDASKKRNYREKDVMPNTKNSIEIPKSLVSKNNITQDENEKNISVIKNKLLENPKTDNGPLKRPLNRAPLYKSRNQSREMLIKEIKNKNKPVSVIYVPLDNYSEKKSLIDLPQNVLEKSVLEVENKLNVGTEIEKAFSSNNMNVGTDSPPQTQDKIVEMCSSIHEKACECVDCNLQVEIIKETFDSLDIPNVTLTKEKNESKDEIVQIHSASLPNLTHKDSFSRSPQGSVHVKDNSCLLKGPSIIIGHATVTCTTRKKINFHVVGSNNEKSSNQSPSPLTYPINVVSIFENEIKEKHLNDNSYEREDKPNVTLTNCLNELQSLNCSYVFNSNKLVKPSDIISTIRVNNGLLHSDFICEQFQRELNFIDSFFESLQYLESCSLSDTCFPENKVKSLIINSDLDVKHLQYRNFLSNLENDAVEDDSETMASESLCLLNLLIRDEQRRAKNLLFVLKMREDALKDFTKSQILWLENKKKQDNTDISTLKKKQRGALLKLQHECGEMQRMRKALLTQSEKRKVALMKTKKNIELKMKNNVDVDQIILGKKKLKRNLIDRNTAPLKCFDLSSSGCEDSSASKPKSENLLQEMPSPIVSCVNSAEKCIQTGDSVLENLQINQTTDTTAENFVGVDGGYLNILFHNLSLPHMFSNGKQYEVNEEALKNILNSANKQSNEPDVVEQFIQHIKTPELESSTPSTARSLVEELDQYYKGLHEEDKSIDCIGDVQDVTCEIESMIESNQSNIEKYESQQQNADSTKSLEDGLFCLDKLCICDKSDEDNMTSDQGNMPQTGPLPVPAGASAISSDIQVDNSVRTVTKSPSDVSSVGSQASSTSLSSLASPVQFEAEELRRQQLAIEREIKALEQQQCQLLVVREIPDKPPPPYTPPAEARAPLLPKMYVADETTEEKILKYVKDPHTESCDPTDAFDTFVKDFCIETLERQKLDRSDKPWDAYNLLPQKPPDDTDKLIKKTSTHLLEILTGGTPSMTGVGSRRSDHIDDILFAEWRRCEPDWTSLHTDEALVKNQIFESIFQKILTETVDEYKRTVKCNP